MAVLSIDGLAESMTQLVITPEDSDEDKDKMPFSVRSISLSPSTRLRLFMENDSFIPAFNNRFEVAISENGESGDMEFIGSARSVSRCLTMLESLKEEEAEFFVKKMKIEKDLHGRLTEKRNSRLMQIMDSHNAYILHSPFPLSFPTEIMIASMDEERLNKTVEEIEMMGKEEEEEEEVVVAKEKKENEVTEAVLETVIENKKENGDDEVENEDGENSHPSDESSTVKDR